MTRPLKLSANFRIAAGVGGDVVMRASSDSTPARPVCSVCSAAITLRSHRRIHRLQMADAARWRGARAGPMLILHVLATMGAGHVLPLHRPGTFRALVPIARDPIETRRGRNHHQQSDYRLMHDASVTQAKPSLSASSSAPMFI